MGEAKRRRLRERVAGLAQPVGVGVDEPIQVARVPEAMRRPMSPQQRTSAMIIALAMTAGLSGYRR
jgi:hypothetical protein